MEFKAGRSELGSTLLLSILFIAMGLACIAYGLFALPVLGIVSGAALIAAGAYPWFGLFKSRKVNVLIGAVTDNYLDSMRLPVAILSATKERDGYDFDPRSVDPGSVVFGPLKARPVEAMSDDRIYRRNLVDVNDDGVPDLVLYFSGDTAGITAGNTQACIWAKTRNGGRIHGCNEINYGYETGLTDKMAFARAS